MPQGAETYDIVLFLCFIFSYLQCSHYKVSCNRRKELLQQDLRRVKLLIYVPENS